ncbi:ankyrin repeat and LEM domain-containing protein 2 [Zootermopsis nevadensis]|uniref:ankyrin repeat and LEM domain-containing protein 2 n=1 Tax=Zootermopsis nevadensis TaxID=136037 RepID=UPI000B8ED1B5|nr:ankyrin repeat and LEM domain-containing protein 2 [Zootermopsis nevadensis]
MCPLSTKLCDPGNSEEIYYGVNIPSDAVLESDDTLHVYNDKSEALTIMKKYKEARLKSFKTRQEAMEFAVQAPEIVVPLSVLTENLETSSPVIGEKPSPFRAPKSQDLVWLRKVIECGDAHTFRNTIWDNPRYLVSSGDTPAILQTVSNVAFIQLLYGDDDAANCQDRARILLDLYLNTPDKALNETPIHFAVKLGAVSVVDVICSRVSSPDESLRQKLSNLLDDMFYVPVLRSEDNSVQPTVGDPFSPACPLVVFSSIGNNLGGRVITVHHPLLSLWSILGEGDWAP